MVRNTKINMLKTSRFARMRRLRIDTRRVPRTEASWTSGTLTPSTQSFTARFAIVKPYGAEPEPQLFGTTLSRPDPALE